ncbi:acyltransferase family protein [Blastopirellula marina]|uniref:Acyltransferase n=1 Tax=Blastopirellula marina TaxID=124 RepID=A0A2S8G994_9BACT|nr:acyltransferase family protein [Blastopirellula marina]PQO40674.1 hypothetical protein C5Y98_05485 [Blastopirellula marina]PTL45634.1 acyltransferase [Blastopirellula marina]
MSAIQYRPALDGLRAVAVIAVILFHLDSGILPGGFVGVDVFFVLSGFLITSIICKEEDAGKFSFRKFYQRRLARIFPASLLVLVVVIFSAAYLYSPQDYASVGAQAFSAAFSLANIKFMLLGNYFEASPDSQPLLHFWSLSVEEQFYIVFPVIIALLSRTKALRSYLVPVLSILLLGSLLACGLLTLYKPTWAFYLLPTRAWELLAGAILAVVSKQGRDHSENLDFILGLTGLVVILGAFAFIHEGPMFPGFIAGVPVVGTLLILNSRRQTAFTERALSNRLLVTIGKMSYSLYLWHWPVFCFVDYSYFDSPAYIRMPVKVALTVVLSCACYYLFENPVRKFLNRPEKQLLGYLVVPALAIAIAVSGGWIRNHSYINATMHDVVCGGIQVNRGTSEKTVVLMGDSNGTMYGTILRDITAELDASLIVAAVNGKDPLPGSELFSQTLKILENKKPRVTVFPALWSGHCKSDPNRISVALDELLDKTNHVILLTQPPTLPQDASRESFRRSGPHVIIEDTEVRNQREMINEVICSLASDRVHVVDVSKKFENAEGHIIFQDSQGRQLWHDRTHLSGFGTKLVNKELKLLIQSLLNSQ